MAHLHYYLKVSSATDFSILSILSCQPGPRQRPRFSKWPRQGLDFQNGGSKQLPSEGRIGGKNAKYAKYAEGEVKSKSQDNRSDGKMIIILFKC